MMNEASINENTVTENEVTDTVTQDSQSPASENAAKENPTESLTRGAANVENNPNAESESGAIDYERIMREDLASLKSSFPELSELGDISELPGALRYAALRDLGLTAQEAYMAASAQRVRRDNRSHLSTAVSRGAAAPVGSMSQSDLLAARQLFSGLTDNEIHNLYRRVKK